MKISRAAAYRLDETADGWRWHVIDADGNTIDAGIAPDKIAARAAIRRLRRLDSGAAEAPRDGRISVRVLLKRLRKAVRGQRGAG
jgi:hypothetical protein